MFHRRSGRGRWVGAALAASGWLAAVAVRGEDGPAPGEGASSPIRVVEKATGRPVAGATVVVACMTIRPDAGAVPARAGETTLRTDAAGRCVITFPPEEVADPRAGVRIVRVDHPDFIPRTTFATPIPLARLLGDQRASGRPYFADVPLIRGVEYTARVVSPAGEPAAGVPFEFRYRTDADEEERPRQYFDATDGRTDAEGRIRLRMPRSLLLAVRLTPDRQAFTQHGWGREDVPGLWAPTDLGQIALEPGVVLTGRLVDLRGKPIADQVLTARGTVNDTERAATTGADGRFAFDPLRPGNYLINGAGQDGTDRVDSGRPVAPRDAAILSPKVVFLETGTGSRALALRAAPTVRVPIRFVDSQGRPSPGKPAMIAGIIPADPRGGEPDDVAPRGFTARVNDPEPERRPDPVAWGIRLLPDAAGLAEFRVPRGLQDARLALPTTDEATAYKLRRDPGGPAAWDRGDLGDLDADHPGVEVVVYRAATILARVRTEGGEPVPAGAKVQIGFNFRGGDHGQDAEVARGDGRFRVAGLMPDFEYECSAWAWGYVPGSVRRLTLAEGATAEVELALRKQPEPPLVGAPAPPLAVRTLDGRDLTLADYRGKHLLLHSWGPYFGWDRDLPRVDALGKRHGAHRLAPLGLACSADVDEACRAIAGWGIGWPQAILRDRAHAPIVQDYGAYHPPQSILIGPDGKVLARDLVGDQVDAAVARALGDR